MSSAAVVIGTSRLNYFIACGNLSSADNLFKLFGPRSGSKLFDSVIVFDSGEKFNKKLILKVADDKKAPSMQSLAPLRSAVAQCASLRLTAGRALNNA